MEERLWTIPEVADFLSVADSTVYRLAEREPDFPAAVRLSPRAVRYRPGEVRDWVRRRQTAADPEPQRRRRGKTPTV